MARLDSVGILNSESSVFREALDGDSESVFHFYTILLSVSSFFSSYVVSAVWLSSFALGFLSSIARCLAVFVRYWLAFLDQVFILSSMKKIL